MKSLACLFAIGILSVTLVTHGRSPALLSYAAPSPQTEEHLRNIKQLTFGGENAEAYFSADGRKLIFQSTRDGRECDQIYTMNVDGSAVTMISNGTGRTTCSYFFPNLGRVLYSSTHLGGTACPPRPDFSKGYVWAIYPTYDIFIARPNGSQIQQLTKTPGYDAEAAFRTKTFAADFQQHAPG